MRGGQHAGPLMCAGRDLDDMLACNQLASEIRVDQSKRLLDQIKLDVSVEMEKSVFDIERPQTLFGNAESVEETEKAAAEPLRTNLNSWM